jgi:hypothetical protein
MSQPTNGVAGGREAGGGRRDVPGSGSPYRLPLALWLVAWLVYGAYFQGQWIVGERPIYHITGDEPHYLVIATSLLRDHDLDVLDNYRDKDYQPFYPYHLGDPRDPEDMHALYGRGGHLYSKHSLGLPLLLLPSMALGGHGLATVFMMGVAALLSVQTFLLARRCCGSRRISLVAWAAVSFSPPLLLYADQFYPEVPGALLLVAAVRGVLSARLDRRRIVAVSLAVGALPWLHLRYVPLAVVIMLAALWRVRRARDLVPWLVLPAAAAGAALLALDWRLYLGVPRVDDYGVVSWTNLLAGVPGLLLDQQYGLLVYAPVYAVALLGLPLVRRSVAGKATWAIPAVLAAYYAFIASFSYWFGAFSPPARMLVPVVPLLVVPLSLALARWHGRIFRATFVALLGLTWSIAHLLLDVPGARYNQLGPPWDGRSAMLEYLSGVWRVDLVPLFPSYVAPNVAAYVWVGVLLAAGGLVVARRRTPPARARAAAADLWRLVPGARGTRDGRGARDARDAVHAAHRPPATGAPTPSSAGVPVGAPLVGAQEAPRAGAHRRPRATARTGR